MDTVNRGGAECDQIVLSKVNKLFFTFCPIVGNGI